MKTLKGMLAIFLALTLAIPAAALSDLPSDWSKAAVDKAVSAKIINISGDKVRAGDALKRWELGYMLSAAFGATVKADLKAFTDIKAGDEGYDSMTKAVKMGLFEGEGKLLRPNAAITRQEAFVVLARALGITNGSASALSKYADKATIASWAQPEIAALTAAGYLSGSDGKLNPVANITRKEFCQLMYNLFKDYLSTGTLTAATGGVVVSAGNTTLSGVTVAGDLVIGDGVTGTVTLNNVKVTGRIYVRNGNVKLSGTSAADKITVANAFGTTTLTVAPGATAGTVTASTPVAMVGIFAGLNLTAASGQLSGYIKNLAITEPTKFDVNEGAVTKAVFSGNASASVMTLAKGVSVLSVIANVPVLVKGEGNVALMNANCNGASLQTPYSKIAADSSVRGVTAYITNVPPGFTVATYAAGTAKLFSTGAVSEARLSSMKIGGKGIPNFDPDVLCYSFAVGKNDGSTLEAITLSSLATVTAVQATASSSKATITILAPDRVTTVTYTVYIYQK